MSPRTHTISVPRPAPIEHRETFGCLGGACTVTVADAARPADAAAAVAMAKVALRGWHQRFSRFDSDSELMRFNRDPRRTVAVSPMLRRLVEVALTAARDTGGLVDASLGAEIERAGYDSHFEGDGVPLAMALELAPLRARASPSRRSAISQIVVDPAAGAITRPPGTVIDPGGIAKGVFADELSATLGGFDAYAIDCAGDIRWGGRAGLARDVHVASPLGRGILHTFSVAAGAIATSGIGKRSWLDRDGRPAHHLLDPRTGRPAFTGVIQATALAPSAAEAEVLAKAALLSGPDTADEWLRDGGLFVLDDGRYELLAPPEVPTPAEPTPAPALERLRRAASQARISDRTWSPSGSLRISW